MPQGTNRYPNHLSVYFSSPNGAQWYFHGPVVRHYLIGFWNGNQPGESLLMEEVPFKASVSINEDKLKLTRWDWPRAFSLEPSAIYSEDHRLWILCPREVPQAFGYSLIEPQRFNDERNATLFYFGPESRQPLSVPIQFEIASPNTNPFVPLMADSRVFERMTTQVGNLDFWEKMPAGFVFASKSIFGHWLISEPAVQAKLNGARHSVPISKKAAAQE
jgi:hypothetical protein